MASLSHRSEHGSSSTQFHTAPPPAPIRRLVSCSNTVRKVVPARRTRQVSFSPNVGVQEVVSRNDMTEEEYEEIWYGKDDFRTMKKAYMPTLKKMVKGIELDHDEEPRGLEHKTPKGSMRRKKNRYGSLDAVLQEQDRQWERNRPDAEFIAEIYIQATAHCRLAASLTAESDAKYVEDFVKKQEEKEATSGKGEDECIGETKNLGTIKEKNFPSSPRRPNQLCHSTVPMTSPRVLSLAA